MSEIDLKQVLWSILLQDGYVVSEVKGECRRLDSSFRDQCISDATEYLNSFSTWKEVPMPNVLPDSNGYLIANLPMPFEDWVDNNILLVVNLPAWVKDAIDAYKLSLSITKAKKCLQPYIKNSRK